VIDVEPPRERGRGRIPDGRILGDSVKGLDGRRSKVSMEQRIQFCTTGDGVRIAYATVREGAPLVKAANWLSHLEYDLQSPVWRHWITELSRKTHVRADHCVGRR
jgi:hypothetical protein